MHASMFFHFPFFSLFSFSLEPPLRSLWLPSAVAKAAIPGNPVLTDGGGGDDEGDGGGDGGEAVDDDDVSAGKEGEERRE
jgi:hypothetical protein